MNSGKYVTASPSWFPTRSAPKLTALLSPAPHVTCGIALEESCEVVQAGWGTRFHNETLWHSFYTLRYYLKTLHVNLNYGSVSQTTTILVKKNEMIVLARDSVRAWPLTCVWRIFSLVSVLFKDHNVNLIIIFSLLLFLDGRKCMQRRLFITL